MTGPLSGVPLERAGRACAVLPSPPPPDPGRRVETRRWQRPERESRGDTRCIRSVARSAPQHCRTTGRGTAGIVRPVRHERRPGPGCSFARTSRHARHDGGTMGSTDRTSPHPTPIVSLHGWPRSTAQSPLAQVPLAQLPSSDRPAPTASATFLRNPGPRHSSTLRLNARHPRRCPTRPLQPVQHPDEYRSSSRIPRVPDPRRDPPLPPDPASNVR